MSSADLRQRLVVFTAKVPHRREVRAGQEGAPHAAVTAPQQVVRCRTRS